MSQIASFYLLKDGQRQELSNGDCSGVVYMAIWDWCESELDLDTLTMLNHARATLLSSLEEACGSCDSLCEESAYPDENAEAILQTVPAELLQKLRKRGLCMRQLARHLRKGDAVYGR